MIAVIQRVAEAKVCTGLQIVSSIGTGLLILLGVKKGDDEIRAKRLAERCMNLRVFEDDHGKFNYSIKDVSGEALVVSQFTLLADVSRGRRPSFTEAEEPRLAERLYEVFTGILNDSGVVAKTGVFGERMSVTLVNDGPVTIILEE